MDNCVSMIVKNIHVNLGNKPILNGVSLQLNPGEVLGLIGPNGAGKSTLIRTLSGVLPFTKGSISINQQDFRHLSTQERARQVAVVPQVVNLPPAFTVWQVVLLGRTPHLNWLGQMSKHDIQAAENALVKTDMLDFKDRRVNELSGGEQQRLLLARALAQEARFLLLDEPTAHLDLQYQVHLLELVYQLARENKLAVLLTMHDLNLVTHYSDTIALLVEGRIQRQGSSAQVLTSNLLSQAYQIPLKVIQVDHTETRFIVPEYPPMR